MTGPWTFGWTQLLTIVGFLITGSIAVTGFRTFERAYHALGVHCRSSGRAHPIIREAQRARHVERPHAVGAHAERRPEIVVVAAE